MSFKEYQKLVDRWTSKFIPQYWKPLEIQIRLTEEVGELARELNYKFGPKIKKPDEKEGDIGDEISDIIFTLICLANSQGIDLDEAFRKMMDYKCKRDENRYKK